MSVQLSPIRHRHRFAMTRHGQLPFSIRETVSSINDSLIAIGFN